MCLSSYVSRALVLCYCCRVRMPTSISAGAGRTPAGASREACLHRTGRQRERRQTSEQSCIGQQKSCRAPIKLFFTFLPFVFPTCLFRFLYQNGIVPGTVCSFVRRWGCLRTAYTVFSIKNMTHEIQRYKLNFHQRFTFFFISSGVHPLSMPPKRSRPDQHQQHHPEHQNRSTPYPPSDRIGIGYVVLRASSMHRACVPCSSKTLAYRAHRPSLHEAHSSKVCEASPLHCKSK